MRENNKNKYGFNFLYHFTTNTIKLFNTSLYLVLFIVDPDWIDTLLYYFNLIMDRIYLCKVVAFFIINIGIPQADGTVMYISRGDYGEITGALEKEP